MILIPDQQDGVNRRLYAVNFAGLLPNVDLLPLFFDESYHADAGRFIIIS